MPPGESYTTPFVIATLRFLWRLSQFEIYYLGFAKIKYLEQGLSFLNIYAFYVFMLAGTVGIRVRYDWTVQGSKPGGVRFFLNHPDCPLDQTSPLWVLPVG